MELREKYFLFFFLIVNLLISCKETLLREMPTGKETKKVELSRNDDLIISPFLFCFVLFIYYYYYFFVLDCFVLFFLFSRIHGNYGLN